MCISHYMDEKTEAQRQIQLVQSRTARCGQSPGLSGWGGTSSVSYTCISATHLAVHFGVPLAPRASLSLGHMEPKNLAFAQL